MIRLKIQMLKLTDKLILFEHCKVYEKKTQDRSHNAA